MNLPLLKMLSEAPGVPGREERVRDILAGEARGLFDQITTDPMGNLIARKKPSATTAGGAKKVLLACHIDEIGFYVRHVDEKGFLHLQSVGAFDPRTLLARRVTVQASSGQDLIGLMNPAGRPLHISKEEDRKKIPEVNEFVVDLCLPAEQVKAKVRIGDPVALAQTFDSVGECVSGKCLDNRVAAFVVLEAMKKVSGLKYEVVLAATVQEEVGLRGAGPAAYAVEPDIAIAIDTTICADTPGVSEEERVTRQGDGVALTLVDSSTISNRWLIDQFESVAKQRNIPHQLSILPRGGTDAASMQRARGGFPAMTLSIPTRYIHTVTECIHTRDLQSAIDLLAAWLET